ncbi:MAG TPA: carboxypeptidase-like regulatory domain-containing protein, partial [Pyrinomonadaceae bacterium]|nr:carboxypeptidase-like regulatory domain-containing protein [Pyrinomonadaceae bacterium]
NTFPCSGVSGCGGPTDTYPIPKDNVTVTNQINPYTQQPIDQPDGVFTMWGGDITSAVYEPYGGGEERRITLTFTALVANPVLAWSGHVAYGGDWGAGNSAGGISGSPYHMRLIDLNGQGGNQDRSLSADAVVVSAIVNIVKVVNTVDGSGAAFTAFPFTASTTFGSTSFSLIDDNAGPGIDTKQSQAITNFGATNTITVTEGTATGWTLAGIVCATNNVGSTSTNLGTATVNIVPAAGGVYTCTYTNTQLAITAAPANITGRVLTDAGYGIRGAVLTLTNLSTGEVRRVITNNFGYYTFTDAMTDDVYNLTVAAKRYSFVNDSRTFTLRDSLSGVDFVSVTPATLPPTQIEAPVVRTVKGKVDSMLDQ